MMPRLSGPSRPPASGGKPRRLVILLHGLGADGNDLIGLAPYWARLLPDAEFLSPNAPFPCDMAPYGYQWFSSQDRSPEAVLGGVRAAAPILDAFIDEALARTRARQPRTGAGRVLAGHDDVALCRAFAAPSRSPASSVSRGGCSPPNCWPASCARARPSSWFTAPRIRSSRTARWLRRKAALKAAGVPVETVTSVGIGHSIDEQGLRRGGQFLKNVLSGTTP